MPGLPPNADDEKEQLLAFLEQQRKVLRLTAYGLTDSQARTRSTASPLTIAGLLKHVTKAENHWIDMVSGQAAPPDEDTYDRGFSLSDNETLTGILLAHERTATRTEELVGGMSVEAGVPVPPGVPWFPSDIEAWTLRWVLLHLIEETARHAGHADIIRESIDGATWFPLMSAAEQWDLRPWVEPWKPEVPGGASV
jgi:uncharacterized damage-inducible protein DinB